MRATRPLAVLLLAGALLASPDGEAQVYKCSDEDGGLTFSQVPCDEGEVARTEEPAAEQAPPENECRYATRFANSTARLMRAGVKSDEVFRRYGGIDSLSRGSIGVINYVYSFRTNESVAIERIAGLAEAKCRAESFGHFRCETLPMSYTDTLGGCDDAADVADADDVDTSDLAPADPVAAVPPETETRRTFARSQSSETGGTRSAEAVEQCKKMYRDQIDAIDAQMRRGYTSEQGERYREQLRGLTQKLRGCDS